MFRNWGRAGDRGGDDAGSGFASRFGARLRGLDDRAMSIFGGFRRGAENAGDEAGSGFLSRFMARFSRIGDEASTAVDGAGNAINQSMSAIKLDVPDIGSGIATKILALVPLIGVLGGGLAALVGALTAVAGAAAFAAGSLAAITTAVGAAGLGIVTLFLALSPVVKLLGLLSAQQKKTAAGAAGLGRSQAQAADQIRQAQQRLAEAEYSLAQARKNASEQAVQDEHSVEDAEYSLAQAQQAARDAQLALTQAREDAKSKLEDLQLQLRGSVLSEEEAALRLQRAQQDYQKTLNNPAATTMDREQARLNLEEAELSLDEATKRNADLEKQAEDANKKGVEGSDQVVSAKKRVHDANHSVAEAEYALAQARQRQADDALKSQHDIARAIQEVANAQRALAQAHQKTGAAATAAGKAVSVAEAGMSKGAIDFANYLFNLKPLFKELQVAAGSQLFGPLKTDIQSLVTNFFPVLKQAVSDTSAGMAAWFGQITSALTSGDFLANFAEFSRLLSVKRAGGSDWEIMGRIIGNVLKALMGLARASEPIFRRFLQWLDSLTGGWADAFDAKGIQHTTDVLSHMGDVMGQFGRLFGNVFRVVGDIIDASVTGFGKDKLGPGVSMVSDMADSFGRLADNLKPGTKGFDRLQQFFENVRGPASAVVRFIGQLGKNFLKLGENPKLIEIFDKITAALPDVEKGIVNFTNKVAPPLIDIIKRVIDIFNDVTNTPAFSIFVGIIKGLADVIAIFVKALTWGPIGKFTGALLGFIAAWVALNKVKKLTYNPVRDFTRQVTAGGGTGDRVRKVGRGAQVLQGVRGTVITKEGPEEEYTDPVTGETKKRKTQVPDDEANNTRARRFGRRLGTNKKTPGAGAVRRAGTATRRIGVGAGVAIPAVLAIQALSSGDIHSVGDAAHQAATFFKDNWSSLMVAFGPQIASSVFGQISKHRDIIGRAAKSAGRTFIGGLAKGGGAAKNLGGRVATRLRSGGGGDSGFFDIKGFTRDANKAKSVSKGLKVGETIAKDAAKGQKALGIMGKLSSSFSKVSGVAKIASGASSMLGPVLGLLTSPIGLVVLGIAALVLGVVELYKHWKPFRDVVDAVGRAFKAIGGVIKNVVLKAFDEVRKHLKLVMLLFGPIGLQIGLIILAFKHMDVIKDIIKRLFSILASIFKIGIAPLVLYVRLMKDVIVGIWNVLSGVVMAIVRGLWSLVKLEFNTAKDLLIGIINVFKDLFTGKWSKLRDDLVGIVKTLWGLVTGMFKIARDTLLGIGTAIWKGISGAFRHMKDDVVGVLGGVWHEISSLPGKIVGLGTALFNAGKGIIGQLIKGLGEIFKSTGSFAVDIGKSIINGIIGAINNVLQHVNDAIPNKITLKYLPDIDLPDNPIPMIPKLAAGATIKPRPGGTLALLAEAGRSESVVDTGLINARLRADATERGDVVAELQRVREILLRIQQMGGVNVEKLEVQAHKDERASESVPRSLRALAFELGA